MIKIFQSKEFLSFIIVGGFAAFLNFMSRILLNDYFSYQISIILAYMVGMITAFILNKIFVFKKSSHSIHKAFLYFTLVNLIAIAQTYIISVGLAFYLFPLIHFNLYPKEFAHAIGISIPVFTSYLGHKYFSFKEKVNEKN